MRLRSAVIAVANVAAAMEPAAISGLTVHRPLRSLDKYPEIFCFGLLANFDIPQIEALVAPRPVVVK